MAQPNGPSTDAADSASILSAQACAFALLRQRLTIDHDVFDGAAERMIMQMQATYAAHLELNGNPDDLMLALILIATAAIRRIGDACDATDQAVLDAIRADVLL